MFDEWVYLFIIKEIKVYSKHCLMVHKRSAPFKENEI